MQQTVVMLMVLSRQGVPCAIIEKRTLLNILYTCLLESVQYVHIIAYALCAIQVSILAFIEHYLRTRHGVSVAAHIAGSVALFLVTMPPEAPVGLSYIISCIIDHFQIL